MNSSSDSMRFSALSARSSARFRRASIRSSRSSSVSVAVLIALVFVGTDFFRGGDSGSYGCVRFQGPTTRARRRGHAGATDVRTVLLDKEQLELIRVALRAVLVVLWHRSAMLIADLSNKFDLLGA
jgi:hypothetical protein